MYASVHKSALQSIGHWRKQKYFRIWEMGTHWVSASRLYRRWWREKFWGSQVPSQPGNLRYTELTLKVNTFKEKEASLYTLNSFIWDLWADVPGASCCSPWWHFSQSWKELIKMCWERERAHRAAQQFCVEQVGSCKMARFLYDISKSVIWCWSFKVENRLCSYFKAFR